VEEEKVPETADVEKTMESMVQLDGAKLVFPTSFGYFDPYMLRQANKFRNVQYRHCGGMWQQSKHPMNTGSYFGYIGMGQYLNGIVAAHATKTKKLGFVAAKPIPQVLINVNSFAMGARSVDPSITVQVIFTGDWSLPVREAEATNALVDAGCDVITCHVDGPKVVIETAEKRGAKSCGHNASQAPLAPKGFLTGAEYKWETIYKIYADLVAKGQPLPNMLAGGYDTDMVMNTPFGAGASEEARKSATAAIADLKAKKPIYVGPLKDNKGKLVIDKTYDNYDPYLDQMDYLLEGVIGSIT
jgi:simple sugar transport system substrate-binding protein